MKPFISCNNPVRINTTKGPQLVSCGKCIQCQNAKRSLLELLLSCEVQAHKYCEMINLTYSSEFVPWIDFSKVSMYEDSFCDDLHFDRCYPIHFGDRFVRKYNPRAKKYYRCAEDISLYPKYSTRYSSVCDDELQKQLNIYNKRINEYYEKYPQRNRRICAQKDHVRVLYYPDFQRFKDRLQQWCRKKFGAKTRYFAIGEYGSNGLHPHFHVLLFHDSSELRRVFEDVYEYPTSTELNPQECAREIYRSSLWTYGIITTTPTDGNASSYVASYVNQSANFPQILAPYAQKQFKSIFLGEKRSYEELSTLLKAEKFDELASLRIVDRKGVEKNVSSPSSSYNRFHIRYTFSNTYDAQTSFALLASANDFLKKTDINIFDDEEVYKAFLFCRNCYNQHYHVDKSLLPLYRYCADEASHLYNDTKSINPLKSLLYAAKKLYKMSDLLRIHPLTYLRLDEKLCSWLSLKRLNELFHMLELDSNFAYQYYSSFPDYDKSCMDFNIVKYKPLFLSQLADANMAWSSSIKHRSVVESYRTNFN